MKEKSMAARTTGAVLDAPTAPDELPGADYDRDFYSWSLDQARLLREGQWAQIDRDNIADEIESLGREQFNKLESALRVLLMHILKWEHQPKRRSRSWIISIKDQRLAINHILADNPGLRPRIPEAIARAYSRAILAAAKETKLDEAIFPERLIYSFEDIMKREFVL
jgi:Domain of unknown function DUF29